MARTANSAGIAPAQPSVPVIHCYGRQADEAFARYSALAKAARQCPALTFDTRFAALRDEAWGAFARAFEVA